MPGPRSFLLLQLLLLALVFADQAQFDPRIRRSMATEDNEEVQQALSFAIKAFNRASKDQYSSRLFRFIGVRKEFEAGVKYNIEAEISRTNCPKSETDLSKCPEQQDPALKKHSICVFEVQFIPWFNKHNLLSCLCIDAYVDPRSHL